MKQAMRYSGILCGLFICFHSCTKQQAEVPMQMSNKSLFRLIQETAGSGYYKNGAVLSPAGDSPHGSFKLRMNAKAQTVLNGDGELPAGKTFPDSSLIVKEIEGSSHIKYAIMYKNKQSWLWAEFGSGGNVVYSIGSKGGGCIPCHSGTPNRDLVRSFDLH